MAEKTDYSSILETPNSSISYGNQQDKDAVSQLIQRIMRLEAVTSKLVNIGIENLEATYIECSLPNISTRMLTLQPSQLTKKEQNCVKFAHPKLELQIKKRKTKNVKCCFP